MAVAKKEMANDTVEIELKLDYDLSDRTRLIARLATLPSASGTHHLVSTYFDTSSHDIARAGYTLRVRRDGRRRIQTVKAFAGAAGLFERLEWERPLRGDVPVFDERAGPLTEVVDARTLARVEPLFSTDVRRTLFTYETDDATIEVAVDRGEVRAGTKAEPLCELELELRGGAPQALFDFARALNERLPLRLGVRSKAERGYALAEGARPAAFKAERIEFDRRGSGAEAFPAIARTCIRQFRLNESLLLDTGGVEALHQARVGLRRLRSALSIYAPLLQNDPRTELLNAELRWLAAELGAVRNIDVLVPRFDGGTRMLLARARDRMMEHVRAELAGARTRLLMIDLSEWLSAGAWRTEPTYLGRLDHGVGAFASDLLEARRDRLAARGEGLSGLDREDRHKVRIEAKKLRYATEFFASLYGTDKARRRLAKFLKALEVLQQRLGDLNDLVTGPLVLARLGIDAELPGSGARHRDRLLAQAQKSFDALMRAKPFW